MPTTPTYALRYQALTDPPNGATLGQNLAEDVETELARIDAAAAALSSLPLGLIAWGRRTTDSTATTSIVGVERLDDKAVTAGRAYRVVASNVCVISTTASDSIVCTIRYTTDGSTPSTASPVLPGTEMFARPEVANSGESRHIETLYVPASNQTLSLLLCVARFAGTGSVKLTQTATRSCDLKLIDEGVAPADTGTDI